jgi:hypothetical protein
MNVESFMNSQKEQSSALFWPPNSLCPACMKPTLTSRSGLRGPSLGGTPTGSDGSSSGSSSSSSIHTDVVHQFSIDETAILTVLQRLY